VREFGEDVRKVPRLVQGRDDEADAGNGLAMSDHLDVVVLVVVRGPTVGSTAALGLGDPGAGDAALPR
jgi:hypothetical protein